MLKVERLVSEIDKSLRGGVQLMAQCSAMKRDGTRSCSVRASAWAAKSLRR
jgi:hypothetical protein